MPFRTVGDGRPGVMAAAAAAEAPAGPAGVGRAIVVPAARTSEGLIVKTCPAAVRVVVAPEEGTRVVLSIITVLPGRMTEMPFTIAVGVGLLGVWIGPCGCPGALV